MREIKFRAWNKISKQLAEVSTLYYDGSVHISYQKGEEINGFFLGGNWVGADWKKEDIVLEQFTGLKDKNGVEIYEGDKIDRIHRKHFEGFSGVVKYVENSFTTVNEETPFEEDCILGYVDSAIEVVGNIHENK